MVPKDGRNTIGSGQVGANVSQAPMLIIVVLPTNFKFALLEWLMPSLLYVDNPKSAGALRATSINSF